MITLKRKSEAKNDLLNESGLYNESEECIRLNNKDEFSAWSKVVNTDIKRVQPLSIDEKKVRFRSKKMNEINVKTKKEKNQLRMNIAHRVSRSAGSPLLHENNYSPFPANMNEIIQKKKKNNPTFFKTWKKELMENMIIKNPSDNIGDNYNSQIEKMSDSTYNLNRESYSKALGNKKFIEHNSSSENQTVSEKQLNKFVMSNLKMVSRRKDKSSHTTRKEKLQKEQILGIESYVRKKVYNSQNPLSNIDDSLQLSSKINRKPFSGQNKTKFQSQRSLDIKGIDYNSTPRVLARDWNTNSANWIRNIMNKNGGYFKNDSMKGLQYPVYSLNIFQPKHISSSRGSSNDFKYEGKHYLPSETAIQNECRRKKIRSITRKIDELIHHNELNNYPPDVKQVQVARTYIKYENPNNNWLEEKLAISTSKKSNFNILNFRNSRQKSRTEIKSISIEKNIKNSKTQRSSKNYSSSPYPYQTPFEIPNVNSAENQQKSSNWQEIDENAPKMLQDFDNKCFNDRSLYCSAQQSRVRIEDGKVMVVKKKDGISAAIDQFGRTIHNIGSVGMGRGAHRENKSSYANEFRGPHNVNRKIYRDQGWNKMDNFGSQGSINKSDGYSLSGQKRFKKYFRVNSGDENKNKKARNHQLYSHRFTNDNSEATTIINTINNTATVKEDIYSTEIIEEKFQGVTQYQMDKWDHCMDDLDKKKINYLEKNKDMVREMLKKTRVIKFNWSKQRTIYRESEEKLRREEIKWEISRKSWKGLNANSREVNKSRPVLNNNPRSNKAYQNENKNVDVKKIWDKLSINKNQVQSTKKQLKLERNFSTSEYIEKKYGLFEKQ